MPSGQIGFFTIDPATGKVTYTFNGVIYAQGLNLVAADDPTTAPDANRITWRWPLASSANRAADIVAARQDGAPANSRLALGASKPGGTLPFASINITQMDATNQPNSAVSVGVDSATDIATVIDGLSQSSFLQLLTVAKRRVSFGIAVCTFVAGGQTPYLSVNHGLGIIPLVVLVTAGITSPSGITTCVASTNSAWTNTIFQVTSFNPTPATFPAAGDTIPVSWLAIG